MNDEKQAARRAQNELMLNELRARNNPLRLQAVQNESSIYSRVYRSKFDHAIGQGYTVQGAANQAEKKADTAAALSDSGNISRPVTSGGSGEIGSNEICMAIINTLHPYHVLLETNCNKLRRGMQYAINQLVDYLKPHFLECSWQMELGYLRVVCADRQSADWLVSNAPKIWCKASVTTRLEAEYRQAGVYKFYVDDWVCESAHQILNHVEFYNSEFSAHRWRTISRKLCKDKRTVELVVIMPEDPDEKLLQAANYVLKYKHTMVKFLKCAIGANDEITMDRGRIAFSMSFPDSEDDSAEDVLNVLETRNESLDTNEWVIADQIRFYKNDKHIFRITFLVDAASGEMIKRANNQLNYKFGKVFCNGNAASITRTKTIQFKPFRAGKCGKKWGVKKNNNKNKK